VRVVTQVAEATSAPGSADRPQRYRADVQGLRAVAVGLVVLDHAKVRFLGGGFVGVDVFFVISGFLITGLLLDDTATRRHLSFGTFYARRALRILPAATVVIVATDVASVLIMNFVHARAVLTDSVWSAFFAANIHFAREGTNYFTPAGPVSPLQHLWSLAVEEQFYVVWPAILALTIFGLGAVGWRRHTSDATEPFALPRRRVAIVLVAIFGVSLYLSIRGTATNATAAYFSTPDRAWELAAGALLAVNQPWLAKLAASLRAVLSWLGVAAIGVAAVAYGTSTAFPGDAALLPVLGSCAVLVGGLGAPRFGANRLLALRPMQFVGNISYSLYLWHWPLLVLAWDYFGFTFTVWQNLEVVAAAIALSTVSYYFLENPIRHWRSARASPRRALVLWPVALTSVLACVLALQPSDPYGVGAVTGPPPGGAATAVRSAVDAGLANEAIPTTLSPDIADAATDFKSIGACSAFGHVTSRLCEMGDPHGKDLVVVFGNSHSSMWIPAMRIIARRAHWRFIPVVKEACGYSDYVASGHSECAEWYRWALLQIRALHPEVLVLGNYVHGAWAVALPTITTAMKQLVPRVILMTDAPGISRIPADCLLQHGATQGTCLWPQTLHSRSALPVLEAIGRDEHVQVVDDIPWFCWHRLCPSVIDATIPYADTAHITEAYSEFLATDLGRALHLG
jgi:peptidoglycan/LPS O-acetylase OafA/YrhL